MGRQAFDTSWLDDYDGLDADEAVAKAKAEGRPYRVIGPHTAVTLELRADRLNVHVDENGRVRRLSAG